MLLIILRSNHIFYLILKLKKQIHVNPQTHIQNLHTQSPIIVQQIQTYSQRKQLNFSSIPKFVIINLIIKNNHLHEFKIRFLELLRNNVDFG